MKTAPFIIILIATILCISGLGSLHADVGLTASGILTVSSFGGTGHHLPNLSSTNQFRVAINQDGQYMIEVRPMGEDGDIFYLTFDGVDTFFVRYREADIGANLNIISREPVQKKLNPAYMSSGNYPFVPWEEQKRAHILWLVFAAGKSLHDSGTNTMPLPWIAARWSLLPYGFRIEHSLSSQPPYLPTDLEFVRDCKLDLSDDAHEMDRPELDAPSGDKWIEDWKNELRERRQDWTNGFVAGRLESSDFTNRNGMAIPLSFSFKAFHPKWTHRTHGLRWQYDGIITNVSNLPLGEFYRPPIIGTVRAEDSRFRFRDSARAINDISYAVTISNAWPSHDSKEKENYLQAGLLSSETSGRFVYGKVRNERLAVAALFLLTSLSLPVFLIWRIMRKHNKP